MADLLIRSATSHCRDFLARALAPNLPILPPLRALLGAAALILSACQSPEAPSREELNAMRELPVGLAVTPGTYSLQAVHSGKCVDVAAASTASGAKIQQYACNGTAAQKWTLKDLGGGAYELRAANSGKCADVDAWGTANGAKVIQWDCHAGANQKWTVTDLGGGQYQFRSAHSGKCLDVSGVSQADGAAMHQWTCYNQGNQKFKLLPATPEGGSGGGGGSGCTASDWTPGKAYMTGNVVRYPADGKYYIAEHDNPGYDPTVSTWFWEPTTCGGSGGGDGGIGGGGGGGGGGGDGGIGGGGGTGFAAILSEATFNAMFPRRNPFYTYVGLLNATASYPKFAGEGDLATQKREVAAFLANVNHETGGLVYTEEIAKGEYCGHDWSGRCACQPGQRYFGRGPIQLSWNYNYGAAGAALGLPLCQDPGLVSRDAKVAWQTGLWFWMTQSGAGSRPAHQSMVNGNGFGETIRTINGSLECNGGNPGQVQSRIDAYRRFCQMLGVDPGANLGC